MGNFSEEITRVNEFDTAKVRNGEMLENQSAGIQVPRDRNSTLEPVIISKHEKRLPLFNDQIVSMYFIRDGQPELRGILV